MSWDWYLLRNITCYFYYTAINTQHTYKERRRRVEKYLQITYDLSRLRAFLFNNYSSIEILKKYQQHVHKSIIKWYADKLQPTHILSIFDSTLHTHAYCVRLINPFDTFRLTFLTIWYVHLVHVQCAQITWNRSDHTVYGFLVSRYPDQQWKYTLIRLFCVKYSTWYKYLSVISDHILTNDRH